MRPKFEVGEVVLLCSECRPELSGEFTVVQRWHDEVTTKTTGEKFIGFIYLLDDDSGLTWVESSLRKKHIPGELNFRELMTSLSSPKLLTHSPQ